MLLLVRSRVSVGITNLVRQLHSFLCSPFSETKPHHLTRLYLLTWTNSSSSSFSSFTPSTNSVNYMTLWLTSYKSTKLNQDVWVASHKVFPLFCAHSHHFVTSFVVADDYHFTTRLYKVWNALHTFPAELPPFLLLVVHYSWTRIYSSPVLHKCHNRS